jgi:hypothetical protein
MRTEPDSSYVPEKEAERAEFLAWSTRLGPITAEALAQRNDLSNAKARERLDEAVRLGLMEKHSVLVGYSDLYTVTVAGRSLVRKQAQAGGYVYLPRMRTAHVNNREVRHTIACAGVAAALERRYPDYRVIGERELRREESKAGRRLASVELGRSRNDRRSHSPDLVAWPPAEDGEPEPLPVAVEVELTLKSQPDLTANCWAWAQCRIVEATLYYVETKAIETRLLDTIEELKAEDRIVVNPLSEILKPPPGFEFEDFAVEAETAD